MIQLTAIFVSRERCDTIKGPIGITRAVCLCLCSFVCSPPFRLGLLDLSFYHLLLFLLLPSSSSYSSSSSSSSSISPPPPPHTQMQLTQHIPDSWSPGLLVAYPKCKWHHISPTAGAKSASGPPQMQMTPHIPGSWSPRSASNLSKGLKDFAQDEVVRTIVLVSSLLSFCLWRILQKNIPMTNISWFFEGRGGAAGAPGLLATCQRDWKTLHRMK